MRVEAKRMLHRIKAEAEGLSQNNDVQALGAIAAASTAAAAALGEITVVTTTVAAPGILGAIGLTTAAPVVVSAAGIVAVAGLAAFGVCKVVEMAGGNKDSAS